MRKKRKKKFELPFTLYDFLRGGGMRRIEQAAADSAVDSERRSYLPMLEGWRDEFDESEWTVPVLVLASLNGEIARLRQLLGLKPAKLKAKARQALQDKKREQTRERVRRLRERRREQRLEQERRDALTPEEHEREDRERQEAQWRDNRAFYDDLARTNDYGRQLQRQRGVVSSALKRIAERSNGGEIDPQDIAALLGGDWNAADVSAIIKTLQATGDYQRVMREVEAERSRSSG